jgi:hypothetical protein
LKSSYKFIGFVACTGLVLLAGAQQDRNVPQEREGKPAETKLVGVSILDPGLSLLERFGSPDEIQPLTIGGGGVGPGGGFGAAGGRPAGGGGPQVGGMEAQPGPPGVVGVHGGTGIGMLGDPFGQQTATLVPPGAENKGGTGAGGGRTGALGGGSGPAAGGGGGVGGGLGSPGVRVLYTRWVYRQGSSRYAFVVDKFNRVIQIEAIGLNDSKVGTSRGIRFGSEFADVISAYNVPDAYEISGDTIVVRYLVRDHVAFRLSRLRAKDAHRVTGIVVAAGKE